ncbi:MAG: TauD/TfdA family dioxygenase [Pseudomonadota bacterium]
MTISIKPATNVGAYVEGVDLANISANEVALLREALGNHGVLFFRQQQLQPEDHISLAQQFGGININRFFQPVKDYPNIAEVRKEPDQSKNIGEDWHTDHSYDQIPALGSILVARVLPASGGDTLFSSMFAAYEHLPNDVKTQVDKLTATHSSRHAFGPQAYDNDDKAEFAGRLGNTTAAQQDAIHPVVIRHPISAKRALYVNPDFTLHVNELPANESTALLGYLYEHCQKEEFIHRFEWQDGSVAFWDNRATWHKALNDYPGQARLMHRITIEGCALS